MTPEQVATFLKLCHLVTTLEGTDGVIANHARGILIRYATTGDQLFVKA